MVALKQHNQILRLVDSKFLKLTHSSVKIEWMIIICFKQVLLTMVLIKPNMIIKLPKASILYIRLSKIYGSSKKE